MSANNDFDLIKEEMASKSDAELNDYLVDLKKYSAIELSLAFAELKKRGRIFSETERENLLSEVRLKLWGKNARTPVYYSRMTIFYFSLFISVFFGSIVMSMNLKVPRERYVVIGFGLTYVISQLTLLTVFPSNLLVHFGFHLIGSATLPTLFWKKYIGTSNLFRKRKVDPVILAAAIIFFHIFIPVVHFYAGHEYTTSSFCLGKDVATIILKLL